MSDKQEQVIIVKNQTNFGLWGVIVGFVGVFVFSIVLSPLAFILGLVGILNGKIVSGIFAILFAILGLITSPIVMGILGLGALIAIPGLY